MSECEVCCGLGRYPVINVYGQELYTIPCPECDGIGHVSTPEEMAAEAFAVVQRKKYDAAMAETRSLSEDKT